MDFPPCSSNVSHNIHIVGKDTLRYQDGDVIVQMSEHPSGIFLVHSEVLAHASEYFRAIFKDYGWSYSKRIKASSGQSKKIWHLQFFFDREQGMCFLTDNAGRISKELENQHPKILTEKEELSSSLTFDEEKLRDWKLDFNELLEYQPRKQFLWYEEQPDTFPELPHQYHMESWNADEPYYSDVRWTSTYASFATSASRILPRIPANVYTRRAPFGHRQGLKYIAKIWETLIAPMYGKKICIRRGGWSWEILAFLAELVVYADYHGALDKIAPAIEDCLLSSTEMWNHVPGHPGLFIMLAYEIKCEVLSIEDTKHVVGQAVGAGRSVHCYVHKGLPNRRERDDELSCFFNDAASDLKNILTTLIQHITHLPHDYFGIRPDLGYDSGWEEIQWTHHQSKYGILARGIILDKVNNLLSDFRHFPHRAYLQLPFHTLTVWLRQISDLAFGRGNERSWITALAEQAQNDYGVESERMSEFLHYYMANIRAQFDKGPLWGHDHHCCTSDQDPPPRQVGDPPHRHPHCQKCFSHCQRCERATVETGQHFTYLEYENGKPKRMISRFTEKEDAKVSDGEVKELPSTMAASKAYLKLVGLDHCVFEKRRKMDDPDLDALEPAVDEISSSGAGLGWLFEDESVSGPLPDWDY